MLDLLNEYEVDDYVLKKLLFEHASQKKKITILEKELQSTNDTIITL